jgi:tRNA-dihydrouridine synthase
MPIKKTEEKIIKAEGPARFWAKDGRILSDLKDLKNALEEMAEETYSYHVNKTRNDFAKWAEEVLKNKKVATELKKAKNKIEAFKKIAQQY